MTAFDRAEEIAASIDHIHHGPNDPCSIRDRILSLLHEEKRELSEEISKLQAREEESRARLDRCFEVSELKRQAAIDGEGVVFLHEEIRELKASLRDVLEISEVEGAVNLTTTESCKLVAARSMLGPESRFAKKTKSEKCPRCPYMLQISGHCTACGYTEKRNSETERLIEVERALNAEVRCDCGVPGCNKLYDHRK